MPRSLREKRTPLYAGGVLLLTLVSLFSLYQVLPTLHRSISAHAAAAPLMVSANGMTYTCVPQPTITPPPTPKGAHAIPENYPKLCSNGQVPQPNANHTPRRGYVPGTPAYNQAVHATSSATKPMTTCPQNGTAYYCYVSLTESVSDVGVDSSMGQPNPYLKSTDYHSLTEIVAEDNSADIVGMGNNVDNNLNGDLHTHLFIESFINGVQQGWNGGNGYVQYSSTLTPGMQVTASSVNTYFYEIEYSAGNWWVYYNTGWVGYYPGSSWTSPTFTSTSLGSWYGEVAASTASPCSDMGNGNFGSNGSATRPLLVAGTVSGTHTFANTPSDTNSSWYDNSTASTGGTTEQFYYGGPGSGGVIKGC